MKYQVKVNGKVVNAYDFEWNDDISLWQAIGENAEELGLAVTEENRADWEDCGGPCYYILVRKIIKKKDKR